MLQTAGVQLNARLSPKQQKQAAGAEPGGLTDGS